MPIHFINFGVAHKLSPLARCVILMTQAYNPKREVHLWSTLEVPRSLVSAPWLSSELNIQTHTIVNATDLFSDTPLLDWYEQHLKFHDPSGTRECPELMGQNIANGFRLAVLWRYGGIYMDSDVIPIAPIPADWTRAVSAQHNGQINNAVIISPPHDPCTFALMEAMSQRFKPCHWGAYGPSLFSHVIGMVGKPVWDPRCRNITVLPPQTFSPLTYNVFRNRPSALDKINASVILGWRADKVVAMHAYNAIDSLARKKVNNETEELASAIQCLTMPRPDALEA
eukprot:6213565-Pleurochrysis_carterae.AAC.8